MAIFVSHAPSDDVHVRCHAVPFAVCAGFAIGNDAGHMGAMAVWIGHPAPAAGIDKILPGQQAKPPDLGGFNQPGHFGDARVQKSHRNALPGHACCPDSICPNHIWVVGGRIVLPGPGCKGRAGCVIHLHLKIGGNQHAWRLGQSLDSLRGEQGAHTANDFQARGDHTTMLLNQARNLVRGHPLDDVGLPLCGSVAGRHTERTKQQCEDEHPCQSTQKRWSRFSVLPGVHGRLLIKTRNTSSSGSCDRSLGLNTASLFFPGSPALTIVWLRITLVNFGSLAVITNPGFRPMALRPRLSPGLPFRSVSV